MPGGIAGIWFVGCVIAISDTATIGQTVSEWIWRRRRTADLSGGNLVVSGSLHVVGNLGCIGTGDLADCKQNLYRGNALHGAEGKQEQQHGKAGHADKGAKSLNKKKKRNTELCFMAWKNVTRYRQDLSLQLVHCSSNKMF